MNRTLAKIFWLLSGGAFLFLICSVKKSALLCAAALTLLCAVILWRKPFFPPKAVAAPGYIIPALLLCSAFGVNFYSNWLPSDTAIAVTSRLGLPEESALLALAAACVLLSVPAAARIISAFTSPVREDYSALRRSGSGKKGRLIGAGPAVLLLALVYLLALSALLRADFSYEDDMDRAVYGYSGWSLSSRFLSNALSTFVHADDFLADASPLPQLISALILAAAGVTLLYVLYERADFSAAELSALVPLGLNPYFLQCFSYKYDSPYMALSVLCGVFPLLYRKRGGAMYVSAAALGTLGVCMTYQASTGVFPMLVILLALRMWLAGGSFKKSSLFCLKSALGYALGLAFFKIFIVMPVPGYGAAIPALGEIIPNLKSNCPEYARLALSDFRPLWLALAAITAILALAKSARRSKRPMAAGLAMTALAFAMMLILCFGMYPALSVQFFAPRAMLGLGVFITLLMAVLLQGRGNVYARLPAFALSWCFFVFAFVYGNALDRQREYADFRIQTAISQLCEYDGRQTGEPVEVQLAGDIGLAPAVRETAERYAVLKRLVPSVFAGGERWGEYRFYEYYGKIARYEGPDLQSANLPVISDSVYQTIRSDGERALIELK